MGSFTFPRKRQDSFCIKTFKMTILYLRAHLQEDAHRHAIIPIMD